MKKTYQKPTLELMAVGATSTFGNKQVSSKYCPFK